MMDIETTTLAAAVLSLAVGAFVGVVAEKRRTGKSSVTEIQLFGMLAFILFFVADIAKLTMFDYPKIALTFTFILGEVAGEWVERKGKDRENKDKR